MLSPGREAVAESVKKPLKQSGAGKSAGAEKLTDASAKSLVESSRTGPQPGPLRAEKALAKVVAAKGPTTATAVVEPEKTKTAKRPSTATVVVDPAKTKTGKGASKATVVVDSAKTKTGKGPSTATVVVEPAKTNPKSAKKRKSGSVEKIGDLQQDPGAMELFSARGRLKPTSLPRSTSSSSVDSSPKSPNAISVSRKAGRSIEDVSRDRGGDESDSSRVSLVTQQIARFEQNEVADTKQRGSAAEAGKVVQAKAPAVSRPGAAATAVIPSAAKDIVSSKAKEATSRSVAPGHASNQSLMREDKSRSQSLLSVHIPDSTLQRDSFPENVGISDTKTLERADARTLAMSDGKTVQNIIATKAEAVPGAIKVLENETASGESGDRIARSYGKIHEFAETLQSRDDPEPVKPPMKAVSTAAPPDGEDEAESSIEQSFHNLQRYTRIIQSDTKVFPPPLTLMSSLKSRPWRTRLSMHRQSRARPRRARLCRWPQQRPLTGRPAPPSSSCPRSQACQ